jgi:LuxR family maltose regulon positive regulatory protein
VLTTKLYIPPFRSEGVSRPRLIERLNEGLRRSAKLTLVSAPAGFGKTTLLSEWVADGERRTRVGWVSLDEGDNDLARFLTYVVAALQQIDDRLGQACQVGLQALQPQAVEPLITALINDVAAFGDRLVLVLDDYHAITLPAIHEAIAFLLDHSSPQLHLVIASRADPPFALSRLRVRRQLTEIRAIGLRFSEEEAAAFLNQVMKLDLSAAEIATLAGRTEGWIAGLQLAALSMESLQDARRRHFIAALTGDDRYILDYLIEEVLDRQPAHVQTFLLYTSILSRLCGPLCDAVLNDQEDGLLVSGQEVLGDLDRNNLFLIPLDNRRCWYRYHHLFADLLRNQLEASRPDLAPALHRRASAWYAANDLRSEAIDHSLAAGDWERVAQLIDEVVNDVIGGGTYFTDILGWLDALPQEVVRAHSRLGIVRAWMLMLIRHNEAAEQCLHDLEGAADGPLPKEDRLQITAIHAFLARQRDEVHKAIELSHQVLDALREGVSAPRLVERMVALNLATTYRMLGDALQSQRWFSAVLTNTDEAGITFTLAAMNGQALVQAMGGQLHQAADTYRRALELADEAAQQSGGAVPAVAWIHAGRGNLLREWNRLDEAARHLGRGLELAQRWQMGAGLCSSYVFLARLRQAQGDMAGALDMIRLAEQLPPVYQSALRDGPVSACRARLMLAWAQSATDDLAAGHLEAVERWAEARGLRIEGPVCSLDDEYEYLVWARLLIAQDKADQALHLLARLLEGAKEGGRTGRAIEILALQALAQQALGGIEQALNHLEQALSLAEPEGYVQIFVDEGASMARLLRAFGSQRSASLTVSQAYIDRLLSAFGPAQAVDSALGLEADPSRSTTLPLDVLTDREMEVLRLLDTELSGPEIAQEFYVSVNTVKTHIKRIYDKLGTHSRYETVERAQELGLI